MNTVGVIFSIKKFIKRYLFLILIILLAGVTRFSFIHTIPVSLYWDEVSLGYNAYSLLQTGKDEYGIFFPLFFQAYDDNKFPVTVYLSIIPIAIFGLNEFSIRFTSALAGVVTVLLLYFLVKEALHKTISQEVNNIALLAAFLLAIAPWHITFSRVEFEANIALCFIVGGVYFFLKGLRQGRFILLSIIFFLISSYTYRSSLLFIPLFIPVISILNFSVLKRIKRHYRILSTGVFVILFLPLFYFFVLHADSRFSQVSVFSDLNPRVMQFLQKQEESGGTVWSRIIYNRRVAYSEIVIKNYLSHFSPHFLFITGDGNTRHSVNGFGLLYIWQLPLVLIGMYLFFKRYRHFFYILVAWAVLSPLGASIASPSPHALRSLPLLPPLIIFSAGGLLFLSESIGRSLRSSVMTLFFAISLVSLLLFSQHYITQNTTFASRDWGDGYKQMIQEVKKRESMYDKVIISGYLWQPYMYTLFYTQYNPAFYHQTGSQKGFGKYIFGGTGWDQRIGRGELHNTDLEALAGTRRTLVALSPSEYEAQRSELVMLSLIHNHNNEVVFILARMK